jgi:hypothetical protein
LDLVVCSCLSLLLIRCLGCSHAATPLFSQIGMEAVWTETHNPARRWFPYQAKSYRMREHMM